MPVDQPRIARVAATGTFQAQPFVNVFHFLWQDPATLPDGADLSGLLGLLGGATTEAKSLINLYERTDTNCAVSLLEARALDAETPSEASVNVTWAGLQAGGDAPALISQVIQWRTTLASRRGRGRTFLPGVNTTMLDGTDVDRFSSTFVTASSIAAQAFANAWATDPDWRFVIYSTTAAEAGAASVASVITTGTCRSVIGVQRRRRPSLS